MVEADFMNLKKKVGKGEGKGEKGEKFLVP